MKKSFGIQILRLNEYIKMFSKTIQPTLLLVLRLFWGMLFFYAGLENYGHPDFLQQFLESLGFPLSYLMTRLFIWGQIIAGLGLMAGFLSAFTSLAIIIMMLIALFTAHLGATLNILSAPYAFVTERPVSYLVVASVIFAFGPGSYSLDHVMFSWLSQHYDK